MITQELMLSISKLSCVLGDRHVLNEVQMELPKGELHCLAGPNGSGKTTLMRVITGLIPRKGGEIVINGRETAHMHRKDMARLVALAQQGGLDALPFSVRDYVLMGRYAYLGTLGRYSEKDFEVCKQSLQRVHADELIDRPLQELSGGERQRVLLARVLAQSTPLVLLDEPTAFLDADGQAEALHLMRSLAHEDGKAVLAVTHDLNLASAYADRIHLLKNGSIICGGRPAEVLNKQALASVYRTKLEIIDGLDDSRPRVFVLPD